MQGKYFARANSTGIGKFGANNTVGIVINFAITQGDKVGHNVRTTLWVSDLALAHTVEKLRKMGWKGNDLKCFVDADTELTEMNLPTEVELVLKEVPGANGKTFTEVQFINTIGASRITVKNAPAELDLAVLSSKIQASCAAPKEPETPFDPSELDDDDDFRTTG